MGGGAIVATKPSLFSPVPGHFAMADGLAKGFAVPGWADGKGLVFLTINCWAMVGPRVFSMMDSPRVGELLVVDDWQLQ